MPKAKKQALVPEAEQPYVVPENWVWTKLGCTVSLSDKKSEQFLSDIKYIGLEHIEKDCGIVSNGSASDVKSLKNVFGIGDILYGKLRPYLNKHGIATFDGICSTDIMVFNPTQKCDIRLVNYFLDTDGFIEYVVANSKGINLPRVSPGIVLSAPFPLPPLAEQHRIVNRIESLFEKLDRAKELAQTALDSFETRKAAILHKAFTGELTAKWREANGVGLESWENKLIRDCIDGLNQGWSPKCESFPSADYSTWGVIKTTAIQHMIFDEADNKQLPANLQPRLQHELKAGDILITRAGPRIRVGVCCLVEDVRPKLMLCDKAYRVSAKREIIIPKYLVMFLNIPSTLDVINRMKTGISDSGVNLTQDGFQDIEIKLPSLAEQTEIVRILDSLLEKEQQARHLANIIEKIDLMKKAILARAFRGELGTNDPAEESALELLKEHIMQ